MISITPFRPCVSQSRRRLAFFSHLCVSLVTGLVASVIEVTPTAVLGAIANEPSKTIVEEPTPTASPVPTEIIVLGRLPQHHYVVIIPVSPLTLTPKESIKTTPQFLLLQRIRTILPQAFLSRHSLGHYIYVGGFDRFGLAQEQLKQIQPNIPNARVVYFP
jgi:hypothetical protein